MSLTHFINGHFTIYTVLLHHLSTLTCVIKLFLGFYDSATRNTFCYFCNVTAFSKWNACYMLKISMITDGLISYRYNYQPEICRNRQAILSQRVLLNYLFHLPRSIHRNVNEIQKYNYLNAPTHINISICHLEKILARNLFFLFYVILYVLYIIGAEWRIYVSVN